MAEIKVGLTQFLDFTLKSSAAKTNFVKNLKSQPEYQPAFDYWKQLRDTFIKFHQNELPFECFETLVQTVDQKKKQNYIDVIKQYKKFIKNKDVSWFDPGKSHWISDDLIVRSSPELALLINDEPHLIKLFFKGKKERIDKYNINSTLTLLNESTFSIFFNLAFVLGFLTLVTLLFAIVTLPFNCSSHLSCDFHFLI